MLKLRRSLSKTQTTTAMSITGVMLLLAIPPIWPYVYYQLLRWIVALTAAFVAYSAYEDEKVSWIGVMVGVAILFNPIVPIELSKPTWVLLDLAVAGIFGYILTSKGAEVG